MDSGINRNIVECKVGQLMGALTGKTVLIETLWNVKEIAVRNPSFVFHVLIETLWNVKWKFTMSPTLYVFVLIETLWNVKLEQSPCLSLSTRRY